MGYSHKKIVIYFLYIYSINHLTYTFPINKSRIILIGQKVCNTLYLTHFQAHCAQTGVDKPTGYVRRQWGEEAGRRRGEWRTRGSGGQGGEGEKEGCPMVGKDVGGGGCKGNVDKKPADILQGNRKGSGWKERQRKV